MYKQKEKICVLHASDEHLVTMLIPYIYEQIKEENKVITIFEKDFKKVAEKIDDVCTNSYCLYIPCNRNDNFERLFPKAKGRACVYRGAWYNGV